MFRAPWKCFLISVLIKADSCWEVYWNHGQEINKEKHILSSSLTAKKVTESRPRVKNKSIWVKPLKRYSLAITFAVLHGLYWYQLTDSFIPIDFDFSNFFCYSTTGDCCSWFTANFCLAQYVFSHQILLFHSCLCFHLPLMSVESLWGKLTR